MKYSAIDYKQFDWINCRHLNPDYQYWTHSAHQRPSTITGPPVHLGCQPLHHQSKHLLLANRGWEVLLESSQNNIIRSEFCFKTNFQLIVKNESINWLIEIFITSFHFIFVSYFYDYLFIYLILNQWRLKS